MHLYDDRGTYKDKPIGGSLRPRLLRRPWRVRRLFFIAICLLCILWFGHVYTPDPAAQPTELEEHIPGASWNIDTPKPPLHVMDSVLDAFKLASSQPVEGLFFVVEGLTNMDDRLINLACEIAHGPQGLHVNILIVGGGTFSLEHFRSIHGYGFEECPAFFHDARTVSKYLHKTTLNDYYDLAKGTIDHIAKLYTPRAFVYSQSTLQPKPQWFLDALLGSAKKITQIVLENSAIEHLSWMVQLSPAAFSAWNRPRLDLIVDASSHAGSLQRLCRTLIGAQYFGSDRPLLSIDFDYKSSSAVTSFVTNLSKFWPRDKIVLRKRMQASNASVLENWYPVGEDHFAVVLSDSHDLSPYFYHYLIWMLMHFHYGSTGHDHNDQKYMYGITLSPLTSGSSLREIVNTPRIGANPVLWQQMDISSPMLLFPNSFSMFHNWLQQHRKPQILVTDAWEQFIMEEKLVLLYPPPFDFDDGLFVLSRDYSSEHHIDLTDGAEGRQTREVELLNTKQWWRSIGEEGKPATWRNLALLDINGTGISQVATFT